MLYYFELFLPEHLNFGKRRLYLTVLRRQLFLLLEKQDTIDRMKYQVGYQDNRPFIEYLLRHGDKVSEVYFPWGDFTPGRGVIASETMKR